MNLRKRGYVDEAVMRITSAGLKPLRKGILIQKNVAYYMGASSSPKHIVVTNVTDKMIEYKAYPYYKTLRIQRDIGEDLIYEGVNTWLKTYGGSRPREAARFKKLMDGKKVKPIDPTDFQAIEIHAEVVGKHADNPEELWYDAEKYGGVGLSGNVYSILSSKGRLKLLKKDKRFKVIKVKEDRSA